MCVSTWRAVQAEGKNRDVTIHGARESAGEAPGQVGSGVVEWWQGMKARKQNYRTESEDSGGAALSTLGCCLMKGRRHACICVVRNRSTVGESRREIGTDWKASLMNCIG